MQQRRVRLGDILDDYCPRERRITNHAVVAMIDDTIKQTRCTTCDADHEYKEAKVPAPRRRKAAVEGVLLDPRPRRVAAAAAPAPVEQSSEEAAVHEPPVDEPPVEEPPRDAPAAVHVENTEEDAPAPDDNNDSDEWPVHRPLIRATLPRPEGQTPERKAPDFTFRSPGGGRFDSHRNGQRKGGHRPMRHAHGGPSGQGRFGGPRAGSGSRSGGGTAHGQGQGQGQRHGNRTGSAGGNRAGRGPRAGGGRKRGR